MTLFTVIFRTKILVSYSNIFFEGNFGGRVPRTPRAPNREFCDMVKRLYWQLEWSFWVHLLVYETREYHFAYMEYQPQRHSVAPERGV